jgi:methylglutaconyl-CoA hydratase
VRSVGSIELPDRLDRASLARLRADVARLPDHAVAVVRGGTPDAFCRGIAFDQVGAVDPAERDAGLADFEVAALALVTSATPTVARVHADALGGGLGIATACDVVLAAAEARFGLPEPMFGLIPGLVLPLVRTRATGPAIRRLALGGETVDAAEALRLGLVDEVVEGGEQALDARVGAWTRRLARAEHGAVGRLKEWLAEMNGLRREVARGRRELTALFDSAEVRRRVGRYQRGLAPWEDDDDGA